jgi:hypothetical protein
MSQLGRKNFAKFDMDAPAALAKCRRQHYRAVAAELIFSNKSRSPNCGGARR